MDTLAITTQLTLEDYLKVQRYLVFRKHQMKGILVLGIFMLLITLYIYFVQGEISWFSLIFGLFLTVILPIQTNAFAKKNYRSNGRLAEKITYEFDLNYMTVTGESFQSKLTWDKMHGVSESKDFILIWQSKQIANAIPKRSFTDEDMSRFKHFVRQQVFVKNRLK